MEDDLKKIMQSKTIKNKRVVAPLRVTLLFFIVQGCGNNCIDWCEQACTHVCKPAYKLTCEYGCSQ